MSECTCHGNLDVPRTHALWCPTSKPTPWPVVGYVIAERPVYGLHAGELVIDWDGKVHETLDSATVELAEANRPSEDDPTQTPSDHWKLYELREVTPSAAPGPR